MPRPPAATPPADSVPSAIAAAGDTPAAEGQQHLAAPGEPAAAPSEPAGALAPAPALPRRPARAAPLLVSPAEEDDVAMSLVDHLSELRKRLLASLVAVGGLTAGCLFFSGWIIDWLKATAPANLRFYTTNPTEVFTVYIKTAAIAGLVLAVPFIFHQVWEFVRPGLRTTERQYTRVFVPAFTFFFFGGALFARYVAVPMGVEFLVSFAQGIAEPIYTVSEYTGFVLQLMLLCGILFEFPIVLYLMASLGFVTSGTLRTKRKLVFFWIFVVSAALTPSTDAGTQIAMAFPILVLFELSLVVMRFRGL